MQRSGMVVLIGIMAVMTLAACGGGNVFSLDVGTCFDDVDEFFDDSDGSVGDVPIVGCDEAHDNEVYAVFDLEGEDHPGSSVITDMAADGCLDRFEPYVGRDYETSRYAVSWLVPTEGSWGQGDREVVCFLYDVDLARLEGSARDSGE